MDTLLGTPYWTFTQRSAEWIKRNLGKDPNGFQLALARSLLAAGSLVTLIFNDPSVLFHQPNPELESLPRCNGLGSIGIFCALSDHLFLAHAISVIVCLWLISGFFHQISGILYWYVATSIFTNITVFEGGDQITFILALILAAIGLTDRRTNMWVEEREQGLRIRFVAANVLYVTAVCQVALLYAHSALAKASSATWSDGTALWYWIQHPGFGARESTHSVGSVLLANPFIAAAMAWGAIILQVGLVLLLIFGGKKKLLRLVGLFLGIMFHVSIAVATGLVSFGLAMSGALVLCLWRPRDAGPRILRHVY